MMDWLNSLRKWLAEQSALEWWLFGVSAGMFVLSPIVAAWFLVRLPSDYFVEPKRRQSAWRTQKPVMWLVSALGRNLLGAALLLAGVVMLVTPGQGLLSIVVGLLLVDLPGKFRLERWLLRRKPVGRSINWLRKRAGRDAFQMPK
jgi:hypothetical protein